MRDVAELLERKRVLLDRREGAAPNILAQVERELREINEELARLEELTAPATAPP